jgi:hypothetical protein
MSMRRVMPILLVLVGLLAFAPAVAADTVGSPRESFQSVGLEAFNSVCGNQTCTDTHVYAERQTTSSGDTFAYACADRFTYSVRTGRGMGGGGGCSDIPASALTVSKDLSSASLSSVSVEFCIRRQCDQVTISAELQATGGSATFRSRYSENDGTCTFTYADSGQRQFAAGSITWDGATSAADGSIFSSKTTVTSKCR